MAALTAKLRAIELKLEWVEKMDTTVSASVETSDYTHPDTEAEKNENDFNREMTFYHQALSAVTKAFKRLKKRNIATRRPTDFFAEMAKADVHMKKVREKLLSNHIALERRDQVRAIREQKKRGKKMREKLLSKHTALERRDQTRAIREQKKLGKKVREKFLSKHTALERRDQVRAIIEQKKLGKKKFGKAKRRRR